MRHLRKGFSLLEILVVIGIISVLLAIAVSSYTTVQKKSRDSKRAGDIKSIQQALEQYYSVCGYSYPTIAASGLVIPIVCTNPSQMIMPTDRIPLDPKTTTPYPCQSCTSSSFTLCTIKEVGPTICVTNQQ